MEIRKLFNVEAAQHVVRNATSHRCSHSVHNHGAIVEVFLTSDKLDNGGMIVDFGILKGTIKQWIDSFDHCMCFWNKDNEEYKFDMKKWNDRWIELPINPTAENLALYMCSIINRIIKATRFNNGEGNVICCKVRYHETSTGYAEATIDDLHLLPDDLTTDYSVGVTNDWSIELFNWYLDGRHQKNNPETKWFENPKVEQQVK